MPSVENKRIMKNTAFLYLRMLLLFFVNFYITRVLLRELGVEDFGLYNVVAGFVSMMGFMNQSMTNSIQRFMNFQMGLGNKGNLKLYFEVSLSVQLIIGFIIMVLLETAGLWFLNSRMTIPNDKLTEANIIYQLSCFLLLVNVFRTPYNAVIIAKEKLNFYAYVSIFEVAIKLLIAFLIGIAPFYKLSFYCGGLLFITLLCFFVSIIYVKRIEPVLSLRLNWDKKVFKDIFSFSGWNLFGTASGMVKSQGINVLMNLFFNLAINAARGVAFQVLGGIQQFVSNFQSAINPQIVQTYANKDKERYLFLTYISAKISVFMMWLIALPIIICIDDVLILWLGEGMVPAHTNTFVIIILFTGLIDSLGSSLSTSIYATGNIKRYQTIVSTIKIMVLPISFVLYKKGFVPETSMYVSLCLAIFEQFMRVRIWSKLVQENYVNYLRIIIIPTLLVVVLSYISSLFVSSSINITNSYVLSMIINGSISLLLGVSFIMFIGLSSNERNKLLYFIKSKIKK